MPKQQACIRCPNCSDYIVLPRQSHLGKFGDQLNPSKDIWPILYLCLPCGQLSEIPAQAIHSEEVETRDRNQLVRYDFASGQSDSLCHCAIYTQETAFGIAYRALRQQDGTEAVERILKVSKIWDDSWGTDIKISIDRGAEYLVPKKLF